MEMTLEQWKERALVAEALLEERNSECETLRAKMEDMAAQSGGLKAGDTFTIEGVSGKFTVKDAGPIPGLQPYQEEALRRIMEDMPKWREDGDPQFWEKYRDELQGQQWTPEQLAKIEAEMLRKLGDKEELFRKLYGGGQEKIREPGRPRQHDWKGPEFDKHRPRAYVENVQAMFLPDKPLARIGFRYEGKDWQMEIDRYELQHYVEKDAARCGNMLADAMADKIGMSKRDKDELALRLMDAVKKLCNPPRGYDIRY